MTETIRLPETIEHVAVDALLAYPKNSRTHSADQVAAVARSIRAYGFTNPILVHGTTIIAGHGRMMAARQIGMATVPAIRLDHLTEAEARAYVIADNRLAELAGWDEAILAEELRALQGEGFDLSLTGFEGKELDELLFEPPAAKTGADEAPAVREEAKTKVGDVWVLGAHRVMCGDSTSTEQVQVLMGGGLADMVFTDPPYGVDYDGGHAVKGKRREKLANDGDAAIYSAVLPVVFGSSKETAALYLWFSDSKSAAVTAAVTAAGYEVRNTIIWNKNLAQFGAIGAQYKSKHEPCLYCFKRGNAPKWRGPTNEVSVWDVKRESKNEFHPTQKPTELVERAVANSSDVGDCVLDVFGGSGSTIIGCEITGRQGRAMEINPLYCDVIVRRWQNFTGQRAIHAVTGEPFGD